MTVLFVAPIVEGHGEVAAVPTLLTRIGRELLRGLPIEVLPPIRQPRSKLVRPEDLSKAIGLAVAKLGQQRVPGARRMVLLLVDAHGELPCLLGPRLLSDACQSQPHVDVACVVANVEYETWFVASGDALAGRLRLLPDDQLMIAAPERTRSGKSWIENRFRGVYRETVDQRALTAKMDLQACRLRSPSFDKLCRELARRDHRPVGG